MLPGMLPDMLPPYYETQRISNIYKFNEKQ